MGKLIEGVSIIPLSIIATDGGDVLHGMKVSDHGYVSFGEVYFSMVEPGAFKGWKRHKKMVLNLIVPVGAVRFVLYDDRPNSASCNHFQEIILSKDKNYSRLTVPPMVWMGFQGLGNTGSMLLNIASIEHTPEEVDRKELNEIEFDWSR